MSAPRYEAAFLAEPAARERFDKVFGEGRKERLSSELSIYPEFVGTDNFDDVVGALQDVRYVFSTWGTPKLTSEQVRQMPSLEALFYAAGTVQYFARSFIDNGIVVSSAWRSIAVPVAAFTVAQMVLATKGYFPAMRRSQTRAGWLKGRPEHPGLSNLPISILGAGTIGSMVIEGLRPYGFNVLAFNPGMSDERAERLGVTRVSLDEAFAQGFIVSNHLANLPATEKMLTGAHFRSMQANSTFINTGRGATVDEEGMIDVLAERPDITALLDVTWPEPPEEASRLYTLPNVFLSPHIAGSQGREILAQADSAMQEFARYRRGEPLLHQVTAEMLQTMA